MQGFLRKPRGNRPAQLLEDAQTKNRKFRTRRISQNLNGTGASVPISHPNKAAAMCQALVRVLLQISEILGMIKGNNIIILACTEGSEQVQMNTCKMSRHNLILLTFAKICGFLAKGLLLSQIFSDRLIFIDNSLH
jgi:hypothetical protein